MTTYKEIPGFEGLYEISDTSLVRSMLSGKIKQQTLNNNGYFRTELYKFNERKKLFIHRVMAEVFVPNPDPIKFTIVNHINGDKTCNLPYNLEWTDKSGNQKHAVKLGLTQKLESKPGERNNQSKLSEDDVRQIRSMRDSGQKLKDVASVFDITESNVSIICRRKGWTHIE